jgi:hypothetical protein
MNQLRKSVNINKGNYVYLENRFSYVACYSGPSVFVSWFRLHAVFALDELILHISDGAWLAGVWVGQRDKIRVFATAHFAYTLCTVARGGAVVEALRHKPEGRGMFPDGVI